MSDEREVLSYQALSSVIETTAVDMMKGGSCVSVISVVFPQQAAAEAESTARGTGSCVSVISVVLQQ